MEPLTVNGTLDSLGAIAQYVMTAAKEAELDKKSSYKLRLAVDEVATNIITHGYEEAGLTGQISLTTLLDENSLTIIVEDTGKAYDPQQSEAVEEDTITKPLEERKIGGLGLYLVMQGVDKFSYERLGDLNRHTFVMHRTQ